jgi:hypothetical protein
MSLEEVVSLEADVTYSLGKLNKKTGKVDPKTVEGYYLGFRKVENRLGESQIHFFKTEKGNVAIWGSTDLNRKLQSVKLGNMTKAEFVGMKETPKGDMRSFKVYQDRTNFIEVDENLSASPVIEDADEDDEVVNDEDDSQDVYLPQGINTVQLSASERQAKVQALLNKNKKK